MLFCLLHESPAINVFEQREIDRNEGAAAHRGRDPELYLQRNGREIGLRDWAREVCEAMLPVAEYLVGELDERGFLSMPLDMAAADRAVGIYDNLRLPDVPGQPRLADAGADWFRALMRAAFGIPIARRYGNSRTRL